MASLRETMTEAFKTMMAERKKEVPVVEKSTLSTKASDSTRSMKMEVDPDANTRQLKVVAEDEDSDDPDMMPVVKDVDMKSDSVKDRKDEKTSLGSAKRLAVVADENVTSNKIPVSKKSLSEKSSETSTDTVGSTRESELTDGQKCTNKGSQTVAEVDRHFVTKAVPTQEKESKEELRNSVSDSEKSKNAEAPVTEAEALSVVAAQTSQVDSKLSSVRKTKQNIETVRCQLIAKKERMTADKSATKKERRTADESDTRKERMADKSATKKGRTVVESDTEKEGTVDESEMQKERKADKSNESEAKKERKVDESEKSNKPTKRGDIDNESELAKAVRAALLGKQRRVDKAKPPSRPPPWGTFNPYAAGPWPEHSGPPAYPYAPQPPHYGMPPPPGGRFTGSLPPHARPPVLPMMIHMEQYASTFFPGYPPHVQQLLARQASRAMGLRSHYTEVVHRDDPPLSGPPPPHHAYPPPMGPGGFAPPPHGPPMPPPHARAHGHDGHSHGPQPPPPPGYLANPHRHGDMYSHPPMPPMAVRHPSRGMPKYHRFGKKPMRAPMSMRDEDAELRFVMSRLAPPNRAKTPMRMTSESHQHPLLSPNAPEFTPHRTGCTRGERTVRPGSRHPVPHPSAMDLPPEKHSSRSRDPPTRAECGGGKFRSPAQTSVFAPCGKHQPKENTVCGKATQTGKSLSPTSPEFIPIPNHDVSKANAVQTVMTIAQERANHDHQFPQEPMKRDLQTPAHEKIPKRGPQRPQPYDHPPKNPLSMAKGPPPPSRGHGGPHFNEVHHPMDAMSPYMPPPGFEHLRSSARVTPDMSRYCSPSLRSLTVKENREMSFDKRYRSGDRYGNWRGGPRVVKDHGAERIQEVIDARQMAHQGAPSLRDITNTSNANGTGKDPTANMKSESHEEMMSRFEADSPPPFLKKNPTSYLEAVSSKSRFGGPAVATNLSKQHPDDSSGQQNIIALAEQNINHHAQKENLPPSPNIAPSDHSHALALHGGHAPPPLTQERRRVTYKEPPRPTLRDLSREARARHERSPENVHTHRDGSNENMYAAPRPMPMSMPMREAQSMPMPSPPGLPIPPHARKTTQNNENRAPMQRGRAQAPALGPAAEPTGREENGKQARMMPPERPSPEVPMQLPPAPHRLAERERRDNHHLRETYKQAQHQHHFTPRSREIRIRDRIAAAEQERREPTAALREERGHSPRSVQDVRERSSGSDRFARDENRGRSRDPDISHLCEQYAIRNECRYGVDTCRYEHVKARDLTDAEIDAIYERRREKKAERKRELEKYRYADHDRYGSQQREGRARRSRSPSYEDDDRRGPSRRSMRSPRDRYDDRDHRGGRCDDADTPVRPRGTAYPTSASSNGGSRNNRDHQRSLPRSNRRDRDDRGSSRPTVRGTARAHRDRDRDYQQDRNNTHRDHQRSSQRDRDQRDNSRTHSRASESKKPAMQDVRAASSQKRDQQENMSPENTGQDSANDGELDAKSKKEKREPSREGALTDIRLAPRENKDEVCRFFGTDKPCWAASRCPFRHVGSDGVIVATAKAPDANKDSSTWSERAEHGVRKAAHESNDAVESGNASNKTVPRLPPSATLKNVVPSAQVSPAAEKTAENAAKTEKAKYSDKVVAGQQK